MKKRLYASLLCAGMLFGMLPGTLVVPAKAMAGLAANESEIIKYERYHESI